MKELSQNQVSIPKPIEFGKLEDEGKVYSLTQWVKGEILETVLEKKTFKEQYNLGIQSGKILRRIHALGKRDVNENWLERYLKVMEPRIKAFHKEGTPFEGDHFVLDFLNRTRIS